MNVWATWAVFRFEWGRTLTVPRLAFSGALGLFPVLLLALVQSLGAHLEREGLGLLTLFVLIPQVLCMMGLLLWATPVIHSELEGRTWAYLALRPAGKGSVLLGKYLAAVAWTALVAQVSLALSMAVVRPEVDAMRVWGVLGGLTIFACLAYGAIYVLLGVIFLRRAMVAAVVYTLISEFALTWVPATIRQLTVQYHLRCLAAKWMGYSELPRHVRIDKELIFSSASTFQHLAILAAFTAVLLAAAMVILRRRELVRASDV
jgi:ABC-type transport system involved in multi-copper enzyme maturation permease subunit